ncbi:hypothetical protein B0H19DRAFT_1142305, partial [Mycena capillaripes]
DRNGRKLTFLPVLISLSFLIMKFPPSFSHWNLQVQRAFKPLCDHFTIPCLQFFCGGEVYRGFLRPGLLRFEPVRTGSAKTENARTSNPNSGSVRVWFRFGWGSEPNSGNTSAMS